MTHTAGMEQLGTDRGFGPAEESQDMSAALARNWWAVALRGVAAIAFGLIALFMPGVTMLSLVLVFAAYAFVDGIFAIVGAVRAARRRERWGLHVLEGIVGIAAGAAAFLWPAITVFAFALLFAARSIVNGALELASAFQLNPEHGRWWLLLGGLVSVIFGLLLILAPFAGAVVLTWWLGAYALVFGGFELALAFRLRSRRP